MLTTGVVEGGLIALQRRSSTSTRKTASLTTACGRRRGRRRQARAPGGVPDSEEDEGGLRVDDRGSGRLKSVLTAPGHGEIRDGKKGIVARTGGRWG